MKNIAGVVVPRLTYSLPPALNPAVPLALNPAVALALPLALPLAVPLAVDPAVPLAVPLDPAVALTRAKGNENVAIDWPYRYMEQITGRLWGVML